jgi:hypothetical protein
MRAIYNKYGNVMKEKDKENLNKAIVKTEKSIFNLRNRKIGSLFFDIFDPNPMMNKWVAVNNLLICLRRNA